MQRHKAVDHELKRRIINFLRTCRVPGLANLEVEAETGTVVIRGTLPSASAKWLCLECSRHVSGVVDVVDEIEVQPLDTAPLATSA